jgi:replication factor A2
LHPVTIKQLHHAVQNRPEDSFYIDGQEIATVTFVGIIRSVNESATSIMYTIEDGTGKIDVRKWINRDEDVAFMRQRSSLREGVYVRIVGELRAFQDQKSITAIHIRPLDDFNEITYHLLEAIHVHLFYTRNTKNEQVHKTSLGSKNVEYMSTIPSNQTTNIYTSQQFSTITSHYSYDNEFTPLQINVRS